MICENCTNSNCTNDYIINKINKIDDKMNIILSVLGNLKIDSKSLEEEMNDLKIKIDGDKEKSRKKFKNVLSGNIKDIKKEKYVLDNIFVKECLDKCSIDSDIKIFKKIYIENVSKELYPIKYKRKKIYYWYNEQMIEDDSNYTYIKNSVIKNIEDCYLNINKYECYEDNIEQFINNQDHINKMSEIKYKEKFIEKIIDIL